MTTPNGQNRQGGGASKVAHLHLDRSVGAAVNELVDVGIAGAVDLRRRADPDDLALVEHGDAVGDAPGAGQIGRASRRARVCQSVYRSVVAVSLKKITQKRAVMEKTCTT